ncbi:hypothetical protein HDU98_006657 [Podochytrium sp. JEL0797]|nr:hypothetical protein HDU98_006657 [Podochytrium sp. JEL0797]
MRGTVVVIGAGPAGIIAAIALQKKGFHCTLYDKTVLAASDEPGRLPTLNFGETGGGVSLYGNGLRALSNLGLLDAVETLRTDVDLDEMNFMLMNGSDRIVRDLSTTKKDEHRPLFVLRAQFHQILLKSAVQLGVKTFVGKKLQSLEESESHVTVTFVDGTVATADFVVGADGVHSATRRLLFPEAAKPTIWGTGYIGVLERQDATFDYGMGLYMDPLKGHQIFFSTCGKTFATFIVTIIGHTTDTSDPKNDDWRPVSDLPKESETLAALTASWGAPASVATCIRNAKRINPVSIYDLPDLATLHKGRVILVGDAAHGTLPTYGQGLNQAIEDGAALGDLFGHFQHADSYKKVFEVYDEVRKPRVQKCAAMSRTMGDRLQASSTVGMRIGRFIMRTIMTVTNVFQLNDAILYHNYRDDLVKAVPDITFE